MSVSSQQAEEVLARFRQQKPQAGKLAELVCLATRIEPGLLREARLRLAPGVDAGAEADLWFSPLVESWSARAFVLSAPVAALLQAELLKDGARAQRAWELIEKLHSRVPPIIAVEERVTWLALSRGTEALPEIERELQAVLRTMLHDERQSAGVARWALRAFPRLPPLVREASTARLLAFGAAARLGTRPMAYSTGPLPVQDTSWLLPHSRTEQRSDLRVERSTAGLTFLSGQERERGHYFLVPATQPVLLEVLWRHNNQEQHQLIEPRPGTTLPIPAEVKTVQLRTVAGDEYELTDQLDKKGRPTPTYLDQTVWQSCVWIPGRLTRATGFFIDPSVIVTSTTAFGSITLGERLEVVWKGKPFTVTLLEANFDSGYVLLELPEGSPSATPLTGEEFLDFERPELDASAPRNWIAYAVLENGQEYWLEGIYRPTLDAQTSSFQVTRSSVPLEELGMPMGLPIFLEGFFLMGQINGWLGERVLIGGTYDAQQALTRLREEHLRKLLSQSTSAPEEISQEEDLSEKEASRRAQDDRLDELRRLILNDGSVKSLILDQLPDQLVDRQITSGRFPSRKHKAFIARIGEISQLSLDLHSMELDSGNTVTIAATAEIDEATLTLPLLHADLFGWSANDADHFLRRPEGWSAEEEEVEAIASLRILVHVQIETDTPEDGMEMISAVHVSAIEDIEIVAVQPQAGPRRRAKAPIRSVATKRSTPRRDPRPSAQKTTSSSSSAPMFDAPVRLFYSYSIRDKALLHRLDTHLEPLKRRGLLSAWRDERIGTRGNWQDQPPKQLEQSNIILLLVSSNFLASKYCSEVEVPAALKRQEEGTAIVVPVLLRDVDRSRTPFAKLRVLPRSEIAVTLWHDEDKALREVAEGLERIIEQELGRRQRP